MSTSGKKPNRPPKREAIGRDDPKKKKKREVIQVEDETGKGEFIFNEMVKMRGRVVKRDPDEAGSACAIKTEETAEHDVPNPAVDPQKSLQQLETRSGGLTVKVEDREEVKKVEREPPKNTYACEICARRFKSRYGLSGHKAHCLPMNKREPNETESSVNGKLDTARVKLEQEREPDETESSTSDKLDTAGLKLEQKREPDETESSANGKLDTAGLKLEQKREPEETESSVNGKLDTAGLKLEQKREPVETESSANGKLDTSGLKLEQKREPESSADDKLYTAGLKLEQVVSAQEDANAPDDLSLQVEQIRSEVLKSKTAPVQSDEVIALTAELAKTKSMLESATMRMSEERARADAAEALLDTKIGLVDTVQQHDNQMTTTLRRALGASQNKVVQSELELEMLKAELNELRRNDVLNKRKIDVLLHENTFVNNKYRDEMRKHANVSPEQGAVSSSSSDELDALKLEIGQLREQEEAIHGLKNEMAREMSAMKEELAVAKRKEVEGANREDELVRKMDDLNAEFAELRMANTVANETINILAHSNTQLKNRLDTGKQFIMAGMVKLFADYEQLSLQPQQQLQQQQPPGHPAPPARPPVKRETTLDKSANSAPAARAKSCRYCIGGCIYCDFAPQ